LDQRHRIATSYTFYAGRIKFDPDKFHGLKAIASIYQPLFSVFAAPHDNWIFEPIRLDVVAKLVKPALRQHGELIGRGMHPERSRQPITAPSA